MKEKETTLLNEKAITPEWIIKEKLPKDIDKFKNIIVMVEFKNGDIAAVGSYMNIKDEISLVDICSDLLKSSRHKRHKLRNNES